jgi:hypothetical protein
MTRRNGRLGRKYNRRGSMRIAAPAAKHPPNRSGDPKGYNTAMFTGPQKVGIIISGLGYPVSLDPKETFKYFQRDYNLAHKYEPTKIPGTLKVDGIAGIHTLNGLEWASNFNKIMPKNWMHYIKKFRHAEDQSKPKPARRRAGARKARKAKGRRRRRVRSS